YTAAGSAHVPTPHVDVVDTVGAGDTLMGSALVWLTENALNTREALKSADADQLTELLEFATTAAAINCTRAGCNPPTRAEIDAALG
ncbi:MAG: PfkB family carbohydrate kinase, partial [Pseudomonadota bacterium]